MEPDNQLEFCPKCDDIAAKDKNGYCKCFSCGHKWTQTEQLIRLNEQYRHNKKRSIYEAISIHKFKDPITRKWVDAVLYKLVEDAESKYIRTVEDFLKSFTLITTP